MKAAFCEFYLKRWAAPMILGLWVYLFLKKGYNKKAVPIFWDMRLRRVQNQGYHFKDVSKIMGHLLLKCP